MKDSKIGGGRGKKNKEDEEVIRIKRTRFLSDKAFNYVTNYFPLEIGLKISEESLYKKPLLQILQEASR